MGSGDSHTSTSGSETPPPAHPHGRLDTRPRQRRNGRVVGALRRRYNFTLISSVDEDPKAAVVGALNLRQSSSTSRLVTFELSGSLGHHLINLAVGEVAGPDCPPVADFTSLLDSFRAIALSSRQTDPGHEIVRACLMALGARRSSHSAITGVAAPAEPSAASCLTQFDLGRRREAACSMLAQRAIDLVESSKFLEDASAKGLEIAAVVRAVLWAVAPYHPFGDQLGRSVVAQHRARYGKTSVPRSEATDSVVTYDVNMSGLLKRPPLISDAELPLFGWTPESVDSALWTLTDDPPLEPDKSFNFLLRTVTLIILRDLLKIKLGPIQPLTSVCPKFIRLYDMLQTLESVVSRFPTAPSVKILNAYAQQMSIEASLAKQCYRHCLPHLPADQFAASMIHATNERYLRWLKKTGSVLQVFPMDAPGRHIRALAMSTFDMFPPWMQVAIAAAQQHEVGVGPLAAISFTKADVMNLYTSLRLGATVFARSKHREEQFTALIEEAGWSTEEMLEAPAGWKPGGSKGKEEKARLLVEDALKDLEAL